MNHAPNYERRRMAVAVIATFIGAGAIGWALGSWDHARIIDGCRTDPAGIYCTPEDQPHS